MRALIIGCGYVGLPLGAELARRGHEVFGIRRSGGEELAAAGITPLLMDVTQTAELSKLPQQIDWVVNTLSSSKGGAEEYRSVYLETNRRLIAALPATLQRFVYTSSTSVYGQTDGGWVDETSATAPGSETSRILVEAEQTLLQAACERNFPAVILRLAGIYGPERGHLFQQYLRGEARLAGDGSRLINMIHRDDVVNAIIAALERGGGGEIYNGADDAPVTQREFFQWLSEQLGGPMPPLVDDDENARRKRALTNKRVSNRKLREALRCEFRFPTFRQGYSAEIARLRDEGALPLRNVATE